MYNPFFVWPRVCADSTRYQQKQLRAQLTPADFWIVSMANSTISKIFLVLREPMVRRRSGVVTIMAPFFLGLAVEGVNYGTLALRLYYTGRREDQSSKVWFDSSLARGKYKVKSMPYWAHNGIVSGPNRRMGRRQVVFGAILVCSQFPPLPLEISRPITGSCDQLTMLP
ncbi:hypothetical protein GGR55DRAFT_594878 [Xylaria sp. FL0064]|nr:hypothetical protein GGR55DRAFT_594878 [Xylaria sp. FL0064]